MKINFSFHLFTKERVHYISISQKIALRMRKPRKRKPAQSSSPSPIMPGAEPIFFQGGEKGILFIHGFTGSPYEGRDFAQYFKEKGYTVWVPLLPGHGTNPRDLLEVRWQDWYQQARENYLHLKRECTKVAVVGQSMGGTLALHLAAHYHPDAVVTLAGFVFLNDWRLKLLPLAKQFIRYQYKSRGPDIHSPQAKRKSASYLKYPVNSILEMLKLIEHVRLDLMDIRSPLLLIHSKKDHVVPFQNMSYIYHQVNSKIKQMMAVENSYHIVSVDYDRERVFQQIEAFLKRVL